MNEKKKSQLSCILDWLFDHNPNGKLNTEITYSNKFILSLFYSNKDVCVFFNTYLNKYNLQNIDQKELLIFLKRLILVLKIKRNSIKIIKTIDNKENTKIKEKVKYLKLYEVPLFEEILKSNNNYDIFMDTIGMTKYKKEKFNSEELESELIDIQYDTEDPITFKEWIKIFNGY